MNVLTSSSISRMLGVMVFVSIASIIQDDERVSGFEH
jgi:hypothetical protein